MPSSGVLSTHCGIRNITATASDHRWIEQCRLRRGLLERNKSSRLVTRASRPRDVTLGWPDAFPEPSSMEKTPGKQERIDVLGLGQAMIDFGASVQDAWLDDLQVTKGSRKLISVCERTQILDKLADQDYQISAGGSLSNTLIDLARLGTAQQGNVHVAMAGLVGSDALGAYYRAQMKSAGVSVVAPEEDESVNTGTVIVLTTEDAQRTMMSYLGTQKEVPIDPQLEAAIEKTSIMVIEGYVWELPNALNTITRAIQVAKKHDVQVAMTAGDSGVVERHSEEIWECLNLGIDILFTNAEEAAALARHRPVSFGDATSGEDVSAIPNKKALLGPAASVAEAAALCLGPHCPMVCVTNGSAGSVIASLGQLWVVPPHWTQSPPVDTCGAGDAWAAGVLYGMLQDMDIVSMGHLAARTASAVIAKHGPTLCADTASAVFPHSFKSPSVASASLHGHAMDPQSIDPRMYERDIQ